MSGPATTSVSNNRPSVIHCKTINSVTAREIQVQLEPMKMVSVSIFLACLFVLLCGAPTLGQYLTGPADRCIEESPYTKDAPSPETEVFEACQPWQSNSCCTAATTRSIARSGHMELYNNFTWNLCGPLSDRCAEFMQVYR